jgi:hypothetical protein
MHEIGDAEPGALGLGRDFGGNTYPPLLQDLKVAFGRLHEHILHARGPEVQRMLIGRSARTQRHGRTLRTDSGR